MMEAERVRPNSYKQRWELWNFLKRLVAVEFVADRKNKLVSALILELESWFHYYCFCSRLRRCMHLN